MAIGTVAACGVCAGLWGWTHTRIEKHIYSPTGFGGYVGANRVRLPDTPLQHASEAYGAGHYAEAERLANGIVGLASPAAGTSPTNPHSPGRSFLAGRRGLSDSPAHPLTPSPGHEALLARRILAYSSARQGRFVEAKARFEQLREAAYESPDHGAQRVALGDVAPTLEEEGAYQEAVCTSAMGDKRGAEAELDGFMRRYPQSILVHAAVKRIGRMHGGDIPKDAEAIWKQAMAVQKAADEREKRDEALCGPECLAELLRREQTSREDAKMRSRESLAPRTQRSQRNAKSAGTELKRGVRLAATGSASGGASQPGTRNQEPATVQSLAAEMHTSGQGTNLASMQAVAAKHGLPLQGVAMTARGLAKQKLPLIALLSPGHYVIVESVAPTSVGIWDPDAHGPGAAGRRSYTAAEWAKAWHGVALRRIK